MHPEAGQMPLLAARRRAIMTQTGPTSSSRSPATNASPPSAQKRCSRSGAMEQCPPYAVPAPEAAGAPL
jgi:hypothetical protein